MGKGVLVAGGNFLESVPNEPLRYYENSFTDYPLSSKDCFKVLNLDLVSFSLVNTVTAFTFIF